MGILPIKTKFPEQFFVEETRCGYRVTTETKRLWAVLLDMLLEFDRVCKKHDIRYSLDSGTLLGAIRHKGFIPWDDDIDVIMLRSEYDRLCEVAPEEFKHPYFWQTNDTDPGSIRRHAQLRNSETTGILKDEMTDDRPSYSFNQGLFIDVFILDEIPDDAEQLNVLSEKLAAQISILWELKQLYFANHCSSLIKEALIQEAKRFDGMVSQYNGSGCRRVANMSLNPQRKENTLFNVEFFHDLITCEFEGFHFPVPRQSDIILTGFYGNWHEYVVGDNMHGGMLVDIDRSYTYYFAENVEKTEGEGEDMHTLARLIHQRNTAWKEIEQAHKVLQQVRKEYEKVNQTLQSVMEERRLLLENQRKPMKFLINYLKTKCSKR